MTDKKDDKSTWAIGGGVLLGTGIGFFPAGISSGVRRLDIGWLGSRPCYYGNYLKWR